MLNALHGINFIPAPIQIPTDPRLGAEIQSGADRSGEAAFTPIRASALGRPIVVPALFLQIFTAV